MADNGIPLAFPFERTTASPLDFYAQVADITARNAIPSGLRWQGLVTFVVADQKNYQLVGGVADANWTEFGSGTVGPVMVQSVADLTARDAIDSGLRTEGMIVYVVSEETNYQLVGGIDNADWSELSGSGSGILTVADTTARDAILDEDRYDGLIVYVIDIQKNYQLRGGITNADWNEIDAKEVLSVVDTTERDAIATGDRFQGMIVYVQDVEKNYQLQGGITNSDWREIKSSSAGDVNFIPNPNGEDGTSGYFTYTNIQTCASSGVNTTTDTITIVGHGFYDGLRIHYTNVAGVGILTTGTDYYVVQSTSTTFKVSLTKGGTAADITTTGAGTHQFHPARPVGSLPGAAANITWATTQTDPLSGEVSLEFTKGFGSQMGEGGRAPFTIDRAQAGRVNRISFDCEFSSGAYTNPTTTTDSSIIVYIYDVTNGLFIEPSSIQLSVVTGTIGRYEAEFQAPSTSTSYQLVLHATESTNTFALKLGNIAVSPNAYVFGSPISGEQSYTLTASNTQGFGTPTNGTIYWQQFANKIRLRGKFTAGTTTATEARIYFPNSLISGDTSAIPTISSAGLFYRAATSANTMNVLMEPSVGYITFSSNTAGTNPLTKANGNTVLSTGETASFFAEIPIQGWASSVQMADQTTTRVVAAQASGTYTGGTAGNPIVFPTVVSDTHGAYNSTTGRFTAPVPGYYHIDLFANSGSNGNIVSAYVDGVQKTYIGCTQGDVNGTISGSGVVYANAGQLIDVRPTSNFGAPSGTQTNISFTRISGPSQIASTENISASYYLSANQSVAANTTPINFDAKEYDTHGIVTVGASWRATAPISGEYEIETFLGFSSGTGYIQVYKNGAAYKTIAYIGGAGSTPAQGGTKIMLNARDYVELRTSGAVSFTGSTLATTTTGNINIRRVGNRG